ncbi:MAG: radical SAM protein [Candidatus Binatia bacterium]
MPVVNASPHIAPPVHVELEPRFCARYVVDLTAGCTLGCIYCPFSERGARSAGVSTPTALDLAPLARIQPPKRVFLSPASDAFAPQAARQTHRLLATWLPRGTIVAIVTKGRVPLDTLDLLAEYRHQVEGVGIGLSATNDLRNNLLEPGCPPARERLANIDQLAQRGIPVSLRMDPLFPDLDDDPAILNPLVAEAATRGATALTATYVFSWGRHRRRLQREPLLAAASKVLTERTPMEGGVAFGVPLTYKLAAYSRFAETARSLGIHFNTCGCKDVRLRESGLFETSCRNAHFEDHGAPAR